MTSASSGVTMPSMTRTFRNSTRFLYALGLSLSLTLAGGFGCSATPQTDLNREITVLKEQNAQKDRDIAAKAASIDELHKKLATATGVDEKQLQYYYYPEKLVLASLTGGYNDDGKAGDDGVVAYLQPVDRDGDVVKVAGAIRVQLFDLANPPDRNFLGEITVPLEKVREKWFGKLMTNHYTVKVPFQVPPAHDEITVRATFVNLFPQRVVTAQSVVQVKLAK